MNSTTSVVSAGDSLYVLLSASLLPLRLAGVTEKAVSCVIHDALKSLVGSTRAGMYRAETVEFMLTEPWIRSYHYSCSMGSLRCKSIPRAAIVFAVNIDVRRCY